MLDLASRSRLGRTLGGAPALVAATVFMATPNGATAQIGPGAAVGIGLGALALGTWFGGARYYGYGYYPYGYGYYPPYGYGYPYYGYGYGYSYPAYGYPYGYGYNGYGAYQQQPGYPQAAYQQPATPQYGAAYANPAQGTGAPTGQAPAAAPR